MCLHDNPKFIYIYFYQYYFLLYFTFFYALSEAKSNETKECYSLRIRICDDMFESARITNSLPFFFHFALHHDDGVQCFCFSLCLPSSFLLFPLLLLFCVFLFSFACSEAEASKRRGGAVWRTCVSSIACS